MIINNPRFTDLPHLRNLWMEAFGDSEEFWRDFLCQTHPLMRCRCVWEENTLAAALYWFHCSCNGKPIAYLYGVATGIAFRGRGLCRVLMENTHAFLQEKGYQGCVLVPGSKELFGMYEKMGYTTCSYVREFSCAAGTPIALRQLTTEEYAQLRRKYLPENGVLQEGETLALLAAQGQFYAGEDFLVVCSFEKEKLTVSELLGNADSAPGILAALGFPEGRFRTPGDGRPFAMYHPLTNDSIAPSYFGLAMD